MSYPFKKGDVVKCVLANPWPLSESEFYTVEKVTRDGYLALEGVTGEYATMRFKIHKPVLSSDRTPLVDGIVEGIDLALGVCEATMKAEEGGPGEIWAERIAKAIREMKDDRIGLLKKVLSR